MKSLVFIAALFFATSATAGTSMSWDALTTRTDGSAITGELSYKIYSVDSVVETDETSASFDKTLAAGTELCVTATETDGDYSSESARTCATIRGRPSPPGRIIIIQFD